MTTLSEAQSKALLAPFGVPFLPEMLVRDRSEVASALVALGATDRPVAAKLCGAAIAHKSERGLLRLGITGIGAVERAVEELTDAASPEDGATGVVRAPMVAGLREFLVGTATDPTFGPTVLVGVGGVLAEALSDVSVRLLPIARFDAHDMLDRISTQGLLGPFRGDPAVDREALVDVIMAVATAAGTPSSPSRRPNPPPSIRV